MLRRIAILAAAVLAVWDLSGCATAGPGQSGDRSGGSAPAAMPVSPPGVSAGLPPEPSATGRCPSGPPVVTVDPGRSGAARCLRVGETLEVATPASPRQPWRAFTSSESRVLQCASADLADGAVRATCRAVAPGTATLDTGTAPFGGDPHGPPQHEWHLIVTVVD
jgi:hypothetical protein